MMVIPTPYLALKILEEHNKYDSVINHSISVCDFCCEIVEILEKKSQKVNIPLVVASALLHDIKKVYTKNHAQEGAELLRQLGFEEVADVVRRHGLKELDKFPPLTIEAKIVFYADKRDEFGKIVSLGERFRCLKERYGADEEWEDYYAKTKKIEEELLG